MYHIYLVEDHPVVREAYARVIAMQDDLVVCGQAETAEHAVEVLPELSCDLVLTDVRLPGMDGIELVGWLREHRPDLPSVVITGHDEASFERAARAAGATAFLPKRRAAADLVPTIREVLAGGDGGR